jgi:hypothetical protein
MSLPKEVEDRLSGVQEVVDEDVALHKMAVRFIQDSEFVSPGDEIRLTYYDAIKTFKAGYKAALEAPSPKQPQTILNIPVSGKYQMSGRMVELFSGEQLEEYSDGSIRIFRKV